MEFWQNCIQRYKAEIHSFATKYVKYTWNKVKVNIVSLLGRDEGYTVKYNPLPEGVPEGEARGNS